MSSISRILLTRMKFIGDVILTTPVIRSVRAAFPDAYIAYMGEKEIVSLLRHNPHLDEIIHFDFTRPTVVEQTRVAWLLRKRRFDVVVDFFSNPRSALLSYASGAPMRIGKEVKGRGALYTHRIADDGKPKTAIEFHFQYVKPLGVNPVSWKTEIFLTEDERREAKIYLQWQNIDLTRPIVALHPSATWPAKMWPKERYEELARWIVARLGANVIVTAGSSDADAAEFVAQQIPQHAKVFSGLPLRQLAAILSHCAVCVTNDAGLMHIAVAVGTSTIGIFGPGEEHIWFPYVQPYYENSGAHVALRKDVSCHPCHLNVCNRAGPGYMECMQLLGVEEVFNEVKKRVMMDP